MTHGARPVDSGSPDVAARLARGLLDDVPPEAMQEGMRLPLHDYLGIELTGLRPAAVEVALTDRTRSLASPLHGGVVATLVDVVAGVAAATSGAVDITRYGLVTARLDIDYRAQPKGDTVRAEAEISEVEHRTVRADCAVTDSGGRNLATAGVRLRLLPGGGFSPAGSSDEAGET